MLKHQEFILTIQASALMSSVLKMTPGLEFTDTIITGIDFPEFCKVVTPHLFIAQRLGLETDPYFRQILPYTIFRKPGNKFITYRRAKGLGESRLLGNYSVGFGGHIEIDDVVPLSNNSEDLSKLKQIGGSIDLETTIRQSRTREIREEVSSKHPELTDEMLSHIVFDENNQFILIDNDVKVGIFHFALITIIDVSEDFELSSNEEDSGVEMIGTMSLEDILETGEAENWTKLFLEYLNKA